MKQLLAILLSLSLLLTGCSQPLASPPSAEPTEDAVKEVSIEPHEWTEIQKEYGSLGEEELLLHIEDLVYREVVQSLNSDEYFVENVSAVFISKEYLDEFAFNSQSNIYFGYTLAELNNIFQGTRYVFTLGEDGQTTVQELQEIDDEATKKMITNIAIGAGVILICVTVSVVSAGAGAAAVSVVFAAAAKTGTIMAISSGGLGAVSAGVVRGIETGDFEEAMDAAAMAGSEGFKWGAISGVVAGGAGEAIALKGATLNGLTMNEAALIQKQSGFPLDVIKQFSSMEQYNICKNAGLTTKMVNGQTALVRNINLGYIDDMGRTNLERMQLGLAPLDDTGISYELHHIGQQADSTLAILTKAEHMQGGNNKIWHKLGEPTAVHGTGNTWDSQRQQFWIELAKMMTGGA